MNRKFDVVAGHMATLAVGLDTLRGEVSQLTATVERLAQKVDRNADGVAALLTLAEMHEREITENREAQARTDERLNALIDTVERYISEGRGGK
ncbi:MAG TPA: hypothetical protein VGB98_10850 [Pyrinomonadaceae bacterium]